MPGGGEDLQRIGVTVFLEPGASVRPDELVPIFHRWIQSKVLDQLWIDVADYQHLHRGPKVLLVAHEGNLAFDDTDGRPGLQYLRKQPLDGGLTDRLTAVSRTAVAAARLLEGESGLEGRVRFAGNRLRVFTNDRLRVPVTGQSREHAIASLRAALDSLSGRLFPGEAATVQEATADSRDRLALDVSVPAPVSLETLADRLDG